MTETRYPPDVIRSTIQFHIKEARDGAVDLTLEQTKREGLLGATVGTFNQALSRQIKDDKDTVNHARHLVWGWVLCADADPLDYLRSRDIDDAMLYALRRWVGSKKDMMGIWRPRESFEPECRWVYNVADAHMQYLNELQPIKLEDAPTMFELVARFIRNRDELLKKVVGHDFGKVEAEKYKNIANTDISEIADAFAILEQEHGKAVVSNWKLKF